MKRQMPKWLSYEDNVFYVDPDIIYPQLLEELGVTEDELDQHWLEVVYQCMKLDVIREIGSTQIDPRKDGRPVVINVDSDDGRKERWALSKYPRGKGPEAATKGREARNHYQRIRGYVPN